MTYQQFQSQGYLLTEADIKPIERMILDSYEAALSEINEKLAVLFAKAKDIDPKDMYNWSIQYNRLTTLRDQIAEIYKKYDGVAERLQIESFTTAFNNQYYRTLYTLEWNEPITFATLDPYLVNYALTGELETYKKIAKKLGEISDWTPAAGTLSATIKDNRTKALKKIYAQINAGLINGEGYEKIAKRIETIIGKEYARKITGEKANAMRIARTEGHRAQNMGELASAYYAEDQGVQIQRMWDATLDISTRSEHAAADGQTVALDAPFNVGGEELQFPGDPSGRADNTINCRCHAITLAGDFKPTARRGRDPVTGKTEVFSYKTFAEWSKEKGLTENKYGKLYK